ncbi:predicted protein [Histoplasma capsulatum H143]|uniref:Uncharacterized protein n=1 Tax=Ajellomyces capsulatus (strain H143) TaxID=544712 RepID=C6HQZ7_AJECH|nr:predicted protein [Histoplasma capsulatum H143]
MVVLIPDPLFLRPTRELSGDASRMGYCTAKEVKGGYTVSVRRTVAKWSLWCQDNPETLKQKRPLCPLHQDWDLRRLHRIVLLGTEATTKLARKTRPSHLLVPGTRFGDVSQERRLLAAQKKGTLAIKEAPKKR